MSIDYLALDIETVPDRPITEYSEAVRKKVEQKISRIQEKNPEFDYNYFASIHGDFGKIICISVGYIAGDETIHLKSFCGDDESHILNEFNNLAEGIRVFVHYNGLNFDIPFILQRMAHHGIRPAGSRLSNLRRYSSEPHLDVMMTYYNWDMQKVLPLGILAELHGLPSPKEDISGDMVYDSYLKGEWERIKKYCEYDTATTLNLWRKLILYLPAVPPEKYLFS